MTKLSVIIPVFNTAKYLKKCLDSIFSQDFNDIEVICVDDGSTDNSLEVLSQYKDIIVIEKSNEGSGVARNVGLKYAKGDYVLFVDSDDWLINGSLIKIFTAAKNSQADVLIFGGLTFDNNHLRKGSYSVEKIPSRFFNKVFNISDIGNDFFKFPSTAWTKLYKREFLIKNNINFQEIFVGQDQIFFIHSMISASKIFILKKNFYCYRKKRIGSVTSCKKKTDFSPIYVFYAVENFLQVYNRPDKYMFLDRYLRKALFWLPKMRDSLKESYFNELKTLLDFVKNNYPDAWWRNFSVKISDSYIKLKIKYFICKLFSLR